MDKMFKEVPMCRYYIWESGHKGCLALQLDNVDPRTFLIEPGIKCYEKRPECPCYEPSLHFGVGEGGEQ